MARRQLVLLLTLAALLAGAARGARIVAVGDVHGEIDGFDSVLQATALTDLEGRWVGGDAILVQTGDVTDRGARVKDVMDRLRALQEQAPTQGGRVVALLGNHEVSNLTHLFDERSTPAAIYRQIWADFAAADSARTQRSAYRRWRRWYQRYPVCVKEENRDWIDDREAWREDHPPGYVEYLEAISPSGEYGRWLRGLDLAFELDGAIFLHGGLSPELVEEGYRSVAAINEAARKALAQFDEDRQWLIDEQVILPISDLWETHCAVYVEMVRLEQTGGNKALLQRAQLAELDARLPGRPSWFPNAAHGPLWYRGLATTAEADLAAQLDGILAAFGAERIAVGHTPQPGEIRSRFDGRVYLIDTAMAYPELGGRASALEIDGDRVTAVYPNERVTMAGGAGEPGVDVAPPETQPVEGTNGNTDRPVEATNGHGDEPVEGANRHQSPGAAPPAESAEGPAGDAEPAVPVWLGPDGEPLPFRSMEEVLDFLAEAKVVNTAAIDTGVTQPRKLLLERDGVRAHAVFHDVEIEKRRQQLQGTIVTFFRDHYANNIAAFELSRMLGMTNVPPAVVRKVGRQRGSVQLWIEDSETEADRRRRGFLPAGDWRLTAMDMHVFDNLANNIDRNQGNILFDADRKLWFIDHTRAFGRLKRLPTPERVRRCSRRLFRALKDLDEAAALARLRPHVGLYEVRGLIGRRDLLVALIEERIATLGEAAVLFDYGDPSAPAAVADEEPMVPEAPAEPPSVDLP